MMSSSFSVFHYFTFSLFVRACQTTCSRLPTRQTTLSTGTESERRIPFPPSSSSSSSSLSTPAAASATLLASSPGTHPSETCGTNSLSCRRLSGGIPARAAAAPATAAAAATAAAEGGGNSNSGVTRTSAAPAALRGSCSWINNESPRREPKKNKSSATALICLHACSTGCPGVRRDPINPIVSEQGRLTPCVLDVRKMEARRFRSCRTPCATQTGRRRRAE